MTVKKAQLSQTITSPTIKMLMKMLIPHQVGGFSLQEQAQCWLQEC